MTAITNIKPAVPALWFGNTYITINLSSAQGLDSICVVEHHMPHGDSPPMHVHRNEDEVFYILSGVLRFRLDDVELVAGAGETVLAPKGHPHTYRVESMEGARVLTITRGSDFETMLRQASRPAERADLPPPARPAPEVIAVLARLCTENGIDIVDAPLAWQADLA